MAVNRIRGAFAVPKKGETFELRAGLVSQYAYERKEAIQKTIMSMTLGKDVSALFPDVLKNIATPDLDQKKLVYLYLMYFYLRWSGRGCSANVCLQELCQIASRPLYFGGEYIRSRLRRSKSLGSSSGNKDDGLYQSRQDGGLYGGTITKNTT
jgi:hypothetical protein